MQLIDSVEETRGVPGRGTGVAPSTNVDVLGPGWGGGLVLGRDLPIVVPYPPLRSPRPSTSAYVSDRTDDSVFRAGFGTYPRMT